MVKAVGAVAILLGAGGIGLAFGNEAREEIRHLEEIHRMTGFLSGEISCCNALLRDAAMNASERLQVPYSTFLQALGDEISQKSGEGFSSIWKRLTADSFRKSAWKKAEQEEYERLGEHLGYLNQSMQVSILEQYRTRLSEKIAERRKKLSEKVKLYNCWELQADYF